MKIHGVVILLMAFFSSSMYAQSSDSSIAVGDVFMIGEISNNEYKYIHFPNPNFITKKGGIANYNAIQGKKIEITSIQEKKDGTKVATIKLVTKKRFFNSHKYVMVAIDEAIANKELVRI